MFIYLFKPTPTEGFRKKLRNKQFKNGLLKYRKKTDLKRQSKIGWESLHVCIKVISSDNWEEEGSGTMSAICTSKCHLIIYRHCRLPLTPT